MQDGSEYKLGDVPVPEDVLRRMNHAEWLRQFSDVLALRAPDSPPMTPMRAGACHRLKMAAAYIELLKKELWRATHGSEADQAEGGSEPAADGGKSSH